MVRYRMKKALHILGCILLAVMLSSCNAEHQKASPMPAMVPPQVYTEPDQKQANPGSLFSEAGATQLFEDNRARRIGDVVVVKIVESTKAKHKADTTANRATTTNLAVSAAFGRDEVGPALVAPLGMLSGAVGVTPIVGATSTSNLSGTGETKRENYVTTSIGVRVTQVLPGGLLQVEGAREIRVNEETEFMVISGLVRPADILPDNTVLSTQLADSSISYYGKGALADKQKSGWLTRLLDNIWPF